MSPSQDSGLRVRAAPMVPLTRCRLKASAPVVHVQVLCAQRAWVHSHMGRICSLGMRRVGWALGSCRPHADNAGRPSLHFCSR